MNDELNNLAEAIIRSPEWIEQDIASTEQCNEQIRQALLEAEEYVADRKIELAAAYALPQNDRRKLADPMNGFEFVCRIIEPEVVLSTALDRFSVMWPGGCTEPFFSRQIAWMNAFTILDRRKETV